MEARLGVVLSGRAATPVAAAVTATSAESVEDAEPAATELATLPREEGAPNAWPDESAESAMISELRERGEKPGAVAVAESVEETDTKPLPPLDELVKRLSPEVREALDDLFRVKFVRVARVPQKALTK